MDEAEFWKLIDESRVAGSCDEQAVVLTASLRERGLPDVIDFSQLMDKYLDALYTWDLWAVAFLAQGGCSDDGFEYFRSWVVACGQAAFVSAVEDPVGFGMGMDLNSDDEDRECEALLYAAGQVHQELTGAYGPLRDTPAPSEPQGEQWDEDELERRYPTLAARWS